MDELLAICGALDIDGTEEISKSFTKWRFDTLNIRGVDELQSKDILGYFTPIDPSGVEWLSNICCNVTFDDATKACNALQAVAAGIIVHKSANPETAVIPSSENIPIDLPVLSSDSLEIPVPPNYRYILGSPHPSAKSIILRFATINDKKITSTSGPEVPPGGKGANPKRAYQRLGLPIGGDRLVSRSARSSAAAAKVDVDVVRRFTSSRVNRPKMKMTMRADEEERSQRSESDHSVRPVSRSRLSSSLASRLGRTVTGLDPGDDSRSFHHDRRHRSSSPEPRFRANRGGDANSGMVTKSKHNVWRRPGGTVSGRTVIASDDLRSRLSSGRSGAMVRVRVAYDDDDLMEE